MDKFYGRSYLVAQGDIFETKVRMLCENLLNNKYKAKTTLEELIGIIDHSFDCKSNFDINFLQNARSVFNKMKHSQFKEMFEILSIDFNVNINSNTIKHQKIPPSSHISCNEELCDIILNINHYGPNPDHTVYGGSLFLNDPQIMVEIENIFQKAIAIVENFTDLYNNSKKTEFMNYDPYWYLIRRFFNSYIESGMSVKQSWTAAYADMTKLGY